MNFESSARVKELSNKLWDFMHSRVFPAESVQHSQAESAGFSETPIKAELKAEARGRGLWNLFLSDSRWGAGLSNLEYAPLAEITGWSPELAPEALNCSAPDTGNMELLARFGTEDQQQRWLKPLLAGEIRSGFSMTEPAVASSDPGNLQARIEHSGRHYIVNAHKWWTTGAMRADCRLLIVMGVSDPDGDRHSRHSLLLVPADTPGVRIQRSTRLFGFDDAAEGGHAEIVYDNVRVPVANLLGELHQGFRLAQARLGPGRIHHCMRLIGMAERATHLMSLRAQERRVFGKALVEYGAIADWIADSRVEIDQARLLVLRAAWVMDTLGPSVASGDISAIKLVVPSTACRVIDRAIQVHGAAGFADDLPLARLYAQARMLRVGDGPDEVHRMVVARQELKRQSSGH
jgi:acyl-CoA dehydrogenase